MRGLHFQTAPFWQSKLVRVLRGKVQDVIVDMRFDSKTFGKTLSIVLSEENKKQLFVPKGFAHAFLVLSDEAEFTYKCDEFYSPEHESGIIYNDIDLSIKWMLDEKDMIISDKDKLLKSFDDAVKEAKAYS